MKPWNDVWWTILQQNIQKMWKNSFELRCIFILSSLMGSTQKKHIDMNKKNKPNQVLQTLNFEVKKQINCFFSQKKTKDDISHFIVVFKVERFNCKYKRKIVVKTWNVLYFGWKDNNVESKKCLYWIFAL